VRESHARKRRGGLYCSPHPNPAAKSGRERPLWPAGLQARQLRLWDPGSWTRKAWLRTADECRHAPEWTGCSGNSLLANYTYWLASQQLLAEMIQQLQLVVLSSCTRANAFAFARTCLTCDDNVGLGLQVMKKHSVPTLDLNALVHSHCGASYTECALCDNETEYMGIQCGYHYSSVGIPILAHAVADAFKHILK
jgi:hypothetical protein